MEPPEPKLKIFLRESERRCGPFSRRRTDWREVFSVAERAAVCLPAPMSITTKKGDDGTTRLMFNRAVPKDDPRVEAYGTVDELNAAVGMARALAPAAQRTRVEALQRHLVVLMGELAVQPEDTDRYRAKGYPRLEESALAEIEAWISELEAKGTRLSGWVISGETVVGTAFDFARTVCRRAERRVCTLHRETPVNDVAMRFLNRLSDLLWLLAREAEAAE